MLTRTRSEMHCKTFLVAIDGSDQAQRGLHLAACSFVAGVDCIKVITVHRGADSSPSDDSAVDPASIHKKTPEGLLQEAELALISELNEKRRFNALLRLFFFDWGFGGDREHYFDSKNGFKVGVEANVDFAFHMNQIWKRNGFSEVVFVKDEVATNVF